MKVTRKTLIVSLEWALCLVNEHLVGQDNEEITNQYHAVKALLDIAKKTK